MQINLTPDYSLFVIMVIFILNYLVVSRFFLRPINEVIEARETETRTANEIYEQSLARFNEATAVVEEKLHMARREASAMRDRFRREAAEYRAAMVARTSNEAAGVVSDADERLKGDIAAARASIVRDSESLARLAAERILGRPV